MDMGLNGKVALVCAASKGLGYAIARSLSAEGALVAICGRNEDTIQAAAKDIEAHTGHPVLAVQAGDGPRAIEAMARFRELEERYRGTVRPAN